MVMVQFNYGVDIDEKMNDLRSKVDSVRKSLPDDAGSPTISKMDPQFPGYHDLLPYWRQTLPN